MNYSFETSVLEVIVISCTYFKVCVNTSNEKIIHLWQKCGINEVGLDNCCLSRFSECLTLLVSINTYFVYSEN